MVRDPEFRSRVLRLLNGHGRPEDVGRLYMGLRFRSFGLPSFREVGDFIAHSEERDKGVVTDELRGFFKMLRFQTQYWHKPFDWNHLPAEFPALLKSNFERLSSADIKQETGLNRKDAKRHLRSALQNFYKRPDGGIYLQFQLSREEDAVTKYCASRLSLRSAFTGEDLYRDFQSVLLKNKLLEEMEKPALKRLQPLIVLSAIPFMHHAIVRLDNGWAATLAGGVIKGNIVVNARTHIADLPHPDSDRILFSAVIVETNLKAQDWCHPTLATTVEWKTPIETTHEPRVIPL
jgi:hypothetical protein